jgi:hypothetical protein
MMTYREFLRKCDPVTAGRIEASRVSAECSISQELRAEAQWADIVEAAAQHHQDSLN